MEISQNNLFIYLFFTPSIRGRIERSGLHSRKTETKSISFLEKSSARLSIICKAIIP
jgi:hypothetical protein